MTTARTVDMPVSGTQRLMRAGVVLVMVLMLAMGASIAVPYVALANTTYAVCPSFATFQSDMQAVTDVTTFTFPANCTLEPPDVTGPIVVPPGANVTVLGNGLTLSGSPSSATPLPGDFNVIEIEANARLILDRVTVQYGQYGVVEFGGGSAFVILTNSTVRYNAVRGIFTGAATVTSSVVNGNGDDGVASRSATVTNSTIRDNGGAGIHAGLDGLADVTQSAISGNVGHGVWAFTSVVRDSSVFSNGGGGVVAGIDGSAQVIGGSVSNNGGDGVSGSTVTVTGSLLRGNDENGIVAETATVTNTVVYQNLGDGIAALDTTVNGGSISENGGDGILAVTATVTDARIADNGAGGVRTEGDAFVRDSILIGDGIIALQGSATVIGSTIRDNRAATGLFNVAGAGVAAKYNATVIDSIVTGNGSVGIGGGQGTTNVVRSTSAHNGSDGVAGITVYVTNSTVTNNAAMSVRGPNVTVTFSTITASGHGNNNLCCGAVLTATIVAEPLLSSNCLNIGKQPVDLGYNLSSDRFCGFDNTGSQLNVTAAELALGGLADNGGPTPTRALNAGSIAVDAVPTGIDSNGQTVCLNAAGQPIVDPVSGEAITTDQRGVSRPFGSRCDIGAFESNRLVQTITFDPLADKTYGDEPFTIDVSSSSGLPVELSAGPSLVCSIAGMTVTVIGVGGCTIMATQPGNDTYHPAQAVARTFNIWEADQTISFDPLPNKTYGDEPFEIYASASSGFPVEFSAGPADVCTISEATITLVGVGTCTVTAEQPGNKLYNPAEPVTRSFLVNDITPPVISGIPSNMTTYATGADGALVTWTPPTAMDDVDGSVTVYCDPPSGSTFPNGLTVVTCVATDASQNTADATFTVDVVRDMLQACLYGGSLSQFTPLAYDGTPNGTCGRGTLVTVYQGWDLYGCLFAGSLTQIGTNPISVCSRGIPFGLFAGTDLYGCLFAGALSQVGTSQPTCSRGSLVGFEQPLLKER